MLVDKGMLIKNRMQSLINLINFFLFDVQTKENEYYRINPNFLLC